MLKHWKNKTTLFLSLLCLAIHAPAAVVAEEWQGNGKKTISFRSQTQTDKEFLLGQPGKALTLKADLRLPPDATGPIPAIIILHGSGGITRRELAWAHYFNDLGMAALLIDSFTARGVTATSNNQDTLGILLQVMDAYRAIDRLAKEPGIDPKRIMLIGFSRGGGNSLSATSVRFQKMYGPKKANFAGYMAFYPGCAWEFIGDREKGSRVEQPIRIFHGMDDDVVPVRNCEKIIEPMREIGADIALNTYYGSTHAFDYPSATTEPHYFPNMQVIRECPLIIERPKGTMINSESGKPFTFKDPCVVKGGTIGYNPDATDKARDDVRAFIGEVIGSDGD
jgi:dienelactone hydrolase